MPGHPPLSAAISGDAAESARAAEQLQRRGDPGHAVLVLEEALAASEAQTAVIPGWLCGRLAALYRSQGRLDDEVRLLERYRDSQVSDDARTRYDARLSKASTLAERKRRTESGALSSVRRSMLATQAPRLLAVSSDTAVPAPPQVSVLQLAAMLRAGGEAEFRAALDAALSEYCTELRALGVPLHLMVEGLRRASVLGSAGVLAEDEARTRFSAALVRMLALYFADDRA